MAKEKLEFMGSQGVTLSAILDRPEGDIKAYALFAHCFTCGKDLSTMNRIARSLNQSGIAMFRFDFTGLGASGGDFSDTNFTSNILDLLSAADFLRQNYQAPKIMIGHSLGGTATLVAATQVPEVKAVATIGSPFDTEHVLHQFEENIEKIESEGQANVSLAGRPFLMKKQFLEDARNQKISDFIARLNKALLVMHSPIDATVGIDNARKIFQTAKHPKSFISLDEADHLLMKRAKDGIYVAQILSAWASQYLEDD